jgi:hypothetical protein
LIVCSYNDTILRFSIKAILYAFISHYPDNTLTDFINAGYSVMTKAIGFQRILTVMGEINFRASASIMYKIELMQSVKTSIQ